MKSIRIKTMTRKEKLARYHKNLMRLMRSKKTSNK
jgi:hypothetical protein